MYVSLYECVCMCVYKYLLGDCVCDYVCVCDCVCVCKCDCVGLSDANN